MENTLERPSRQSAHLARQRKSFIEAGQQTLATSGLSATIEDFAISAGVTVATLYNHFPSKDALIQLAFAHSRDDWEEWMRATVSPLDDAAERLVCSFRLFLRVSSTHPQFSRLASVAIAAGSPIIMATAGHAIEEVGEINHASGVVLSSPEKRFQSFFAALLAEFQQQGLVADPLSADVVVALLLPLLGFSELEAHELVSKRLPPL